MGPWMMGGYGYGYAGWWGLIMLLFWLLVIAGGVALVVWLVRQGQGSHPAAGGDDRALATLRERYARGELTQDEFEQMRRTLQ